MTSPIETNNVVERRRGKLTLLLAMVEADIQRTSETESFMVRSGLLRDIILENQSLSDRIDVQTEALIKCRAQFLEYERHHRDEAERLMLERDTSKVAVARLAKAARNREMADMIEPLSPKEGRLMGKLTELAERCEKATGANKMLDEAIFEALAIVPSREHYGVYPHYAYTASLDAAMTLVPEDWFFHVSRFSSGEGPLLGNAHVYGNRGLGDDYEADAATPALALCAAALRARTQNTPDSPGAGNAT